MNNNSELGYNPETPIKLRKEKLVEGLTNLLLQKSRAWPDDDELADSFPIYEDMPGGRRLVITDKFTFEAMRHVKQIAGKAVKLEDRKQFYEEGNTPIILIDIQGPDNRWEGPRVYIYRQSEVTAAMDFRKDPELIANDDIVIATHAENELADPFQNTTVQAVEALIGR